MHRAKIAQLFYKMTGGFVISFSLPATFELVLFTLAEIQTWAFIISKQFSTTPDYFLDFYTKFIHYLTDIISLKNIIPEDYYLGLVIVITIYLLLFCGLIGQRTTLNYSQLFKIKSHKVQAIFGMVHSQLLFFWINIILIHTIMSSGRKGLVGVSYAMLALNNLIALLGAGYSVSPFLTKTLFASEEQKFPVITFAFRTIFTFFNFLEEQSSIRATFSIISLFLYIIQLIVLVSKFPFYKFLAMKFRIQAACIGIFLTGILVLYALFIESGSVKANQVWYVETLVLIIAVKIFRNIADSFSISYLEKYRKNKLKHTQDIIKTISVIDYYMTPQNLKLDRKNPKLVYIMQLIMEEDLSSFTPPTSEDVKLQLLELEKLSRAKFIIIEKILNKSLEHQKVDPIIKIFLAELYLDQRQDFQRAAFMLEGCKTNHFIEWMMIRNLKVKILKQYKRRLSVENETHDIEIFVEREDIKENLIEQITISISLQQQFLKLLYDSEGRIEKLLALIQSLEEKSREIDANWKKLYDYNTQTFEILPLYAFYLAAVQNLPHSADKEMIEYTRRTESYLMKATNNDNKEIVLTDPSNLIIKFSMGKSHPGKILYATDNVNVLGWELRDILTLNVSKIIPDFLHVNEKNLAERFFSVKESYFFSSSTNFGFLNSKAGFLVPCNFKLFLNPQLSNDIIFIAFCKVRMSERYAIAEHNRVLAVTQNVVLDTNSLTDPKIGSLLHPTLIHGIMRSPNSGKTTVQLSLEKIKLRHQVDEKMITIFSRKYRFLTLHPVLEGALHKFQTLRSSDSSSSNSIEDNISEGRKILMPKKTHIQRLRRRSNNPYKDTDSNDLSPERRMNHKHGSPDRIILKKSGGKLSSVQPEVRKPKKIIEPQIVNIESSINVPSNSKYFRKIQNSIEYIPPSQFSNFLSLMNFFLFILSTVLLFAYYFYVKDEFAFISSHLSSLFYTIKGMQMVIEGKRPANAFYMNAIGVFFPNRSGGNSIYNELSKQYILNNTATLIDAQHHFESNFDIIDDSILDLYYDSVIPIRENSRTEPPVLYYNIQTFFSKYVLATTHLAVTDEIFPANDRNVLFLVINSFNDLLIQLEKIAETCYSKSQDRIELIVQRIGIFTATIGIFGFLNMVLMIFKEKRTRTKKRYLLTMLSLLEDKEIIRVEQLLSEFILESKKTSPKNLAIPMFEKFMEEQNTKLQVKKNAKSASSAMKKYSTLQLPNLDLLKSLVSLFVLIVFMVLPYLALIFSFISSGDKNRLKKYIDIQYTTEISYYHLRLLIVSSLEYYYTNGTATLKNRPINDVITELQDSLTHFQPYLASLKDIFNDEQMNWLISGNICTLLNNPYCFMFNQAITERGIIGLNSYQLDIVQRTKNEFDTSPKSFMNMYMAINNPDVITSEAVDAIFDFPLYDQLLALQYKFTINLLDRVQQDIVAIVIIFFTINLMLGTLFTKGLSVWLTKEREGWIRFARRLPFKIATNSKVWLAYLNDQNKRDLE